MLSLINWRLKVTVNDGRAFVGQMLAFDRHMNLVLAECEEFRRVRQKRAAGAPADGPAPVQELKRTLGLVILRGETVVSLSVEGPPPVVDEDKKGAVPFGPGRGVPAGRGMGMMPPSASPACLFVCATHPPAFLIFCLQWARPRSRAPRCPSRPPACLAPRPASGPQASAGPRACPSAAPRPASVALLPGTLLSQCTLQTATDLCASPASSSPSRRPCIDRSKTLYFTVCALSRRARRQTRAGGRGPRFGFWLVAAGWDGDVGARRGRREWGGRVAVCIGLRFVHRSRQAQASCLRTRIWFLISTVSAASA